MSSSFSSFWVSSHYYGFTSNFWSLPLFYRSVKMIHIQMEDYALFLIHSAQKSHVLAKNFNLSKSTSCNLNLIKQKILS